MGQLYDQGERIDDALRIKGSTQQTVTLGTTAAQSAVQTEGIYAVDSDVACFIKVHPTADDVTTATGFPLYANNQLKFWFDAGDKLGGVVASGSGTLRFHKVS